MNRFIKLLRKTSVASRLLYLFLVQTTVIVLFCAATVRSSIQGIADNLRLSGSQLLYAASGQMQSAIAEVDMLTKFPVLQAAYGSTSVFDYLSSDTPDTSQLISYYRSVQQDLMNLLVLHSDASLLGISDLGGQLVYCKADAIYYSVASLDPASALFEEALRLQGGYRVFTASQLPALITGLPTPEHCLLGVRAIMKLNRFAPVGFALCCIDLAGMKESFELGRLYPEQRLSVLGSEGEALFGALEPSVYARLRDLPAGQLSTKALRGGEGFAIYQTYRSEDGLLCALRTPLRCVLGGIRTQLLGLGGLLLFFVLSVLLFTRLLVSSIREPIGKLMGVCERIREEDFSPAEDEDARDEMHSLIESFNAMSAHIQRLIEEVYSKNLLQAQTEMQLLRSQINPHFVYNTLETIRAAALAQGSPELADMAALLGKTLRYGVSAQSEPVTVEQELSNLRDYVRLQQMHFHGRLAVQINVEPDLLPCFIIKLLLQPLVENAIYHGMSMTEGEGRIRVLGYAEEDDVVFTVADDGIGIAPEELSLLCDYIEGKNDAFTSIGLRNTNRRIRLYYGSRYGLALRSILGEGTLITVRVPRMLTKSPSPQQTSERGEA